MFSEKLVAILLGSGVRNAFCIQGSYYTYADLSRRISAIQQVLAEEHNSKERIGVIANDTVDTYASLVAILLLGKTYIPIHPGIPAERVASIISQSEMELILSSEPTAEFSGVSNISIASLTNGAGTIRLNKDNIAGKNAYILFTSGSTGVPKGTPITYNNLDSFINAFDDLGYELTEADRFLQMFDLTFDLSVMSYLIPLCTGACVYTIPEKGMKFTNVYSVLEEYQITFALMVPSVLTFLRQYFDEIRLPEMRYALFCGEALHKSVVQEWRECVPNAVVENVYGPTEATIFCLTYNIDVNKGIAAHNDVVCIGKPMTGMEAIVVDEHNRPLADGEKGELCLHGNQVTPGYLDEEKSKAVFFELNNKRYYRTGDIATRNSDGNFSYCGRADQQVKIQGFRVELGEIEHHTRAASKCNAVAIVVTNSHGLSRIDVAIESAGGDTDAIIAGLKTSLPDYMLPTNVYFIAPFPLNVNGKTDRKEIEKIITAAS